MLWFKKKESPIKSTVVQEELEVVSDLSSSILSTLELSVLLQNSVNDVVRLYKLLGGIVLLLEKQEIVAYTISANATATKFLNLINVPVSSLRINLEEGKDNYIVKSVLENKIYVGHNLGNFTSGVLGGGVSGVAATITNTKSCISLPISSKKEVIGAIFLSKKVQDDFEIELPLLKLVASQIGIAIENARLYEQVNSQVGELKVKNEELNKAHQRESDIIDIMGHELRTPLSILKISLSLSEKQLEKSEDKDVTKEVSEYYRRMRDALTREVRLLETLLTSTKVDAGKVPLHPEKVNIIETINDSILAIKNKAFEKGLTLKNTSKPEELFVFADSVRLAEVLDNLVVNAVKYTEKGGVEIQATTDGEFVNIQVIDTGLGISEKDLERLGEKFFRGVLQEEKSSNGNGVMKPGGTGLGLYVAFELITLMGGTHKIESKIGVGSTFSFTIPKYNNQKESEKTNTESKNIFDQMGFTHQNQ